jgi:CheY-like chemotaxis protein
VLVIDDSPLMLQAARIGLDRLTGWRVSTAASGHEGVTLAASGQPDAILLDVVMPELDGPATLRALDDRDETRTIPVVFLTASDDADHARLIELGAVGLIAKPFDPGRLGDQLSEVLGWSR